VATDPYRFPVASRSLTIDESYVIVTGAPAAGKSTVSQLVARALPRAARLNGDFVHELIVSGFVWGLGEPAVEAARQATLTRRNLSALAVNFADAGFTPVIDTLLPDRAALDELLDGLGRRPALLIVLAPDLEKHRTRNAGREREEQFSFADYETLAATMRRDFGSVGWWVDTSELTAAETATQIVRDAATRARVGGSP
jgi:hypothetical protein